MNILEKTGITAIIIGAYFFSRWMVAAVVESSERMEKKREELNLSLGCFPFSPLALMALVIKYLVPILLVFGLILVWAGAIL